MIQDETELKVNQMVKLKSQRQASFQVWQDVTECLPKLHKPNNALGKSSYLVLLMLSYATSQHQVELRPLCPQGAQGGGER